MSLKSTRPLSACVAALAVVTFPLATTHARAQSSSSPVLLSPSGLWFGEQAIGVPSQPKTVTVLNNASQPTALTFASLTASGDYAETDTCVPPGSASATLAPGASCTVTVIFTPQDRGRRSGAVTIADSAANSPQQIQMAGTGLRVSVALTPGTATVAAAQTQQFTAAGSNTNNSDVLWYVDGAPGGSAVAGTISAAGLYTAPGQAGSHAIVAVSQLNPAQSGTALVTVTGTPGGPTPPQGGVIADFASRVATPYPIPANILGAGRGGGLQPASLPLMTQAGLTYTRFHAAIQDVYASATPYWANLDASLAALQASGMHVILEMDFTPASLQPSSSDCTGQQPRYASEPTNLGQFAQMAASYVTHIDHAFPGVVGDYEIWNEPDGGGLCAQGNSDAVKLNKYLAMYGAVAPALRAAATQDGVQIHIGGPTLGAPQANANEWISALLTNPATAPYVDFISYHYYAAGRKDVAAGLTWDGAGGTPSLLAESQDPQKGVAAIYQQVAGIVSRESPTPGVTLPIYLDEYNSDWAFLNDCCRNDATYAPLWNSAAIVDLLNTVYSGAPAVPNKVLYYAISNPPFCLVGQIDAAMDCAYPQTAGAVPQAYPQYYALQLFASPSFLNLQGGGYMANLVASGSTDLLATAFYTGTADTVVIVNTSNNDHNAVPLVALNPGASSAAATTYTLNSSNPTITTGSVPLSPSGPGVAATVSVPHHSVVAVSLAAPPAAVP